MPFNFSRKHSGKVRHIGVKILFFCKHRGLIDVACDLETLSESKRVWRNGAKKCLRDRHQLNIFSIFLFFVISQFRPFSFKQGGKVEIEVRM